MAAHHTPRSVADATRFTSSTPHANVKAASASSSSSKSSPSKTGSASSTSSRPAQSSRLPPAGMPRPSAPESMEERVRRLRAAHLAARKHETSRLDQVVNASRRYFDAAHKFTVLGLIGFSGLALFVTIYATADMMVYNRKRRNEFFALQRQLKSDSLEAARLAYITNSATPEQIALVEEAEAKARDSGMSLPPLLSAPRSMSTTAAEGATATETVGRTAWAGESLAESSLSAADEVEKPKSKGLSGWLFGGLKKEEPGSEARLNFDAEAKAAASGLELKEKAKTAFEQERENQRTGGPLDQLGKPSGGETKKSSWW
ncbi:uncharacterized protein GGS22DRAFT_97998 [Annulohypoxylon maeteangense]|uniref:uncharacterized protein n=1 Tax=Annulohypoxylon maeteangense TaxID=1927788 RepID=UPI0020078BDE|nr:uncharacterized protein GGS22DRAFT_97998 [Annulohypoxylon maeteangense]KAI0888496.1 hypothetical protein GGS22DRAFT_97998 [Annulohypoxylon maeteangense]